MSTGESRPHRAHGTSAPTREPAAQASTSRATAPPVSAADPAPGLAVAPTAGREHRRTALGRLSDRLVALGFVVLLAVPAVALAAGLRPNLTENRAPATFPAVAVEALTNGRFFLAIDRFLADNLPWRDRAVGAYAGVDHDLLGGSTNPDVVIGRDGWLFYIRELQPQCGASAGDVLAQIDRLAAAAARNGQQFRFQVAPDKHAIYPEQLPPAVSPEEPCTDRQRSDMRAGMAGRPGVALDAWGPILALRQADPAGQHYWREDSHWSGGGAMPAIQMLVESLAPGVWNPADVKTEDVQKSPGELATLLGQTAEETAPRTVVRRAGTLDRAALPTRARLTNAREIRHYRVSGVPVVPGRTLMIYDSFLGNVQARVAPWFEESIWVHWQDLLQHPELAADLPEFDSIVVSRAERGTYDTDFIELLAPVLPVAP